MNRFRTQRRRRGEAVYYIYFSCKLPHPAYDIVSRALSSCNFDSIPCDESGGCYCYYYYRRIANPPSIISSTREPWDLPCSACPG